MTRSFKRASVARSRQISHETLVTSEASCLAQMGNLTEQSLTRYHAAAFDQESGRCELFELDMMATPGSERVDLFVAGDSEGKKQVRTSMK